AEVVAAGLQVVSPAGIERVDDRPGDEPVPVATDFGRQVFIPGLRVAIGDGTRAGHDSLVDLLRVHQPQQVPRGVMPQPSEGEMAQVGVHVDDHVFLPFKIAAMLPPRIFCLSVSLSSAARIRPMPAVMDMSQPKRSRSTPRVRAASSTTPSSGTLP